MKIKFLFSALAAITLISFSCEKENKCKEDINPDCYYTMDYNPVCGCNGKTFSNSSHAACSGISEYTEGECK